MSCELGWPLYYELRAVEERSELTWKREVVVDFKVVNAGGLIVQFFM